MNKTGDSNDFKSRVSLNPKTVTGKLVILIFMVIIVLIGFSVFVYRRVENISQDYYKLEKYNFAFQNVFIYQTSLNAHQLDATEKIYNRDTTLANFSTPDIIKSMDSVIYALSLADTVDYQVNAVKTAVDEYQNFIRKIGTQIIQNKRLGNSSRANDSSMAKRVRDNEILGKYYGKLYGVHFVKLIAVKDGTNERLLTKTRRLPFIIIVVSLIMGIAFVAVGRYILVSLTRSIRKPKQMLQELAVGKLPDIVPDTHDELSYIVEESNRLATNLRNACDFALAIGQGNFEHSFSPSSKDDALGNALVKMSRDLKAFHGKEKQQNWVVSGQAKFADIIRNRSANLKETADTIISQLVKYLGANLGGLFFYEADKAQLEMLSCYAYDRIKFLQKSIPIGEGLVGQCFQEGETIYINDVPEDYLKLVSGLGKASPKAILLVPMIYNDKIEGVIELATVSDFPPHYIGFVEQLGSILAGAIGTIKHSQYTEQLLAASQNQSQSLSQQEEELRQNLEELHATQEELMRREATYLEEIRVLKNKLG